jgi:hypothetical protein
LCFWKAVQQAHQVVWPLSLGSNAKAEQRVWNGEYFQEYFAQHRESTPPGWVQAAVDVLFALIVIKVNAQLQVNERSHTLKILWEQGKPSALLAAVQERLPAEWVKQATAELQRQQIEGDTPEKRKRAQSLLRKIQKAKSAIGKGNTEHLSAHEKPRSKRAAVSRSKAVRRLLKNFARWLKLYGDPEAARRQTVMDFEEKSHLTDTYQRALVLEQFRKRMKTTT